MDAAEVTGLSRRNRGQDTASPTPRCHRPSAGLSDSVAQLMSSLPPMHAILCGRDHEELGTSSTSELTSDLAIGLTRGRHLKAYAYTDPNEDVVGARSTGERVAMYVADGHSGLQASHVAVEELEHRLGPDLTAFDGRQQAVRTLHAINEAIREARRALTGDGRRTRTTLTIAIVERGASGRTVHTASVGDSVVMVVSPTTGARALTRDRHRFLGDRCSLPEMAGATHMADSGLADDEHVVVATDGLTNFARLDDIGPAVIGAASAVDAADALIELACDGGAGDNVAVAVLTPEATRG